MDLTEKQRIPYVTGSDFIHKLPEVSEQQAKRIDKLLTDAKIPPGNPDLNDILERIATIGPPHIQTLRGLRFKVEARQAWDIGPLSNDPAQSSTTQLVNPDGNGHIRVTAAGWYSLWVVSSAHAEPGSYYLVSITAPGQLAVEGTTSVKAWGTHAHLPSVWLDAGARVKFGCAIDRAGDVTSTVKIQYHGNRRKTS